MNAIKFVTNKMVNKVINPMHVVDAEISDNDYADKVCITITLSTGSKVISHVTERDDAIAQMKIITECIESIGK